MAEAATIEIGSTKRRGSDGNILHETNTGGDESSNHNNRSFISCQRR